MSKKLYEENDILAIANSIRAKNGSTDKYKVADMAAAVSNLNGSDNLVTFNQMRPEVQNYLNNVTYNPTDYTTSQIANHVTATSNNHPEGCKINLKSAGTLIVYDSANGGSMITNSVAGDNYIYNLTPNAICTYVNIVDGNIEQSGTIKALGQIRMIKSASAPNVRDLGGWACDGGTVKYGKLFRGGEISINDRTVLVDFLGIKHDINLRGKSEATWTVSPLGNDVCFHVYDSYAWYSIDNSNLLKNILTDIFNAVKNNEPVYFHCSAGADRTGTVALILEAILGVSQSDMDKDYELTSFYSGVQTDLQARRRNESEWTGLINSFSAFQGETFRDKVVSWVLSLGIPIETINNFRSAMIDGTPEILSFSGESYTVSVSLENASISNDNVSANQYSEYSAEINPEKGYIISDISILMGGIDITSKVWSGNKTNFNYSVSNNLINCSTNNNRISVISGQSYGALITPNPEHSLANSIINIKMGGIDVSDFYSDGKITIPRVTGNIEINITAQASAPEYVNQILTSIDSNGDVVGLIKNKRYNSSDTLVDGEGLDCCGFISAKAGDVIRFRNLCFGGDGSGGVYLRLYKEDKTIVSATTPYGLKNLDYPNSTGNHIENIKYNANNDITEFTIRHNTTNPVAYFRLAWVPDSDGKEAIITVNEEIN